MADITVNTLLVAIVAIALGFAVTIAASQRAVSNAAALAAGTRIPPFIIGITLLAIGTDLPEIANSIAASITGHGDINVGDSVGSAVTQATLVVGLLPIVGGAFIAGRQRVARIGGATVGALLLGALLMLDGDLSRGDAILLIGSWLAGSALVWRDLPPEAQPSMQVKVRGKLRKASTVLIALGVVAVGATVAVWGLTTVAKALSVSEYLVAFVLASLGTSLPELVVNLTAIRQGQRDLAVGGALGASFVDSTLSIAAGPLIAPVAVTASLVVRGSIAAAATIAVVVVLLSVRRHHDRVSGFILVALYFTFYAVVIAVW
jgi:cation:H+ antiporter